MKDVDSFHFGYTRAKVYELVTGHCPVGKRILEYSCGDGALCAALQEVGYEVTGTNYSVYKNANKNVKIVNGVDLTEKTPFENESFDCVIISETVQNIPNHVAVYKEVARVLKQGGIFVMTTPNIMSIKSRIHFFLTGLFKVKWKFIGFDVPMDCSFAYHNHPVHLPVALYYFHALNMKPIDVDGVYPKLKSYLFYLLFAWLIIPCTWLTTMKKETNLANSKHGKSVFEALTARTTLCCDRLALAVRKEGDSAAGEVQSELPDWITRY
ncbi:class I SAM-dependent methyltransferase [Pseudodesulfovibrio alkaliphilus]|nr:class I SAM-dependent methyltransferase [Pseudodesulfovibrio alkaliphilus]